MIFDSIDDLRCLENISNEDEYTVNTLFEDKQLHALLDVSVHINYVNLKFLCFIMYYFFQICRLIVAKKILY